MNWEELKQNPLIWIIIALILVTVVGFFSMTIIVNKTTNSVIQKLQKEYTPGPYSPGFDPDKVNPNLWRNQQPQQTQSQQPQSQQPQQVDDWHTSWEEQRKMPSNSEE